MTSPTQRTQRTPEIECNCGLPQAKNPHPEAGKMEHLNRIGACYGCLPCAEKRATGRAKTIQSLRRWLEVEVESTGSDIRKEAMQDIVDKLNKLEGERQADFRKP